MLLAYLLLVGLEVGMMVLSVLFGAIAPVPVLAGLIGINNWINHGFVYGAISFVVVLLIAGLLCRYKKIHLSIVAFCSYFMSLLPITFIRMFMKEPMSPWIKMLISVVFIAVSVIANMSDENEYQPAIVWLERLVASFIYAVTITILLQGVFSWIGSGLYAWMVLIVGTVVMYLLDVIFTR